MPGRPAERGGNDEGLLDVERNGAPAEEQMSIWVRFQVAIVFVIFVLFRALDRVFSKNMNNMLLNPAYTAVWQNLLWPFFIQILTMILIGGYILLQRMQGHSEYNCRFFLPRNPLASTKGAMPMYMLALFSLGDQLNAAIQAPAGPFVSQSIQSVFTNSILVWMMPVAFFWIGARYKQTHFAGVVLVVVALVVPIAPQIVEQKCSPADLLQAKVECFSAYHSPLGGGDGTWILLSNKEMIMYLTLFLVSTIPAAVGNVYKQKVLQGCDADVFYVSFWSGGWQMVWGWFCLPLMWLRLPGQPYVNPGDTLSAIKNTLSCIAGNVPQPGDETCAAGSTPLWVWVILYLCFNLTFNLCITWLTKHMTAAWTQVATVLCLNLCNFFSSVKQIMGANAQPLTIYDWLGAIIVSVALWVFNIEPETIADGKDAEEHVTGSFVAEKMAGATPTGSVNKVQASS